MIRTGVSKERAVAFVVARLSSSRLPNKQFLTIGGESILGWIVASLRQCSELQGIVITTVAEPCNEPLRSFAQKEDLPCFWYDGDVDHVTTRLRRAAEAFNADICVLISGDCPLIYAPTVDHLIRELRSNPDGDYVAVIPNERGQLAATEGISVGRKRAWQLADDLSDTPELKEHQFPSIRVYPDRFTAHACRAVEEVYGPHHRFSVDTYADLQFMNQVYRSVTSNGQPFAMPSVLQTLRDNPWLCHINAHVHQRRLRETIHPVLHVVDAGPRFGYGHLLRSQELALQIVERASWPVSFLVDDEQAAALIESRGLKVYWGAVRRPANEPPFGRKHQRLQDLVARHHCLLLDIYPRDPGRGWRQEIGAFIPTIVLDKVDRWAMEADLIIIPGITGPEPSNQTGLVPIGTRGTGESAPPPVLSGLDYVILRRDAREQIASSTNKVFDILAYLHHPRQRERLRAFVTDHHLNAHILDGLRTDFLELLAKSRLFMSGFGYSFYEALALHAYPVTWPYSSSHANDARVFYARLGLEPAIIEEDGNLDGLLSLLHEAPRSQPTISDGTPSIVQVITDLVCSRMA